VLQHLCSWLVFYCCPIVACACARLGMHKARHVYGCTTAVTRVHNCVCNACLLLWLAAVVLKQQSLVVRHPAVQLRCCARNACFDMISTQLCTCGFCSKLLQLESSLEQSDATSFIVCKMQFKSAPVEHTKAMVLPRSSGGARTSRAMCQVKLLSGGACRIAGCECE
jgi:hypothetical protein